MIPLFGIGVVPAIVALFMYSLLPIVRNTVTALVTVDPVLRRVSLAMGLTRRQELRHVFVPLSMPSMLAGVRTAAVICIGTATLAAFIGAGGLGDPIRHRSELERYGSDHAGRGAGGASRRGRRNSCSKASNARWCRNISACRNADAWSRCGLARKSTWPGKTGFSPLARACRRRQFRTCPRAWSCDGCRRTTSRV